MSSISVVIPCHNEADGIAEVIASVPKPVFEIIVVDNNSTDASAQIAARSGARIVKESRKGYGFALRAGFAAAKGDVIVTIDGDGQYPASEVKRAVKYLDDNNLDFVICSRFPLDDKKAMNFTRRFGNAFFTILTNILFRVRFTDSWSGMMCFRTSIVPELNLESGDMPLSQEIKIKAARNKNLRYGEVHVGYAPRVGDSKLSPFRHGFQMLGYSFELWNKLR